MTVSPPARQAHAVLRQPQAVPGAVTRPAQHGGADGRRIPAGCLQVQDEAGRIPMGSPGQGGPGGAPAARGRARALCRSSGSRCSTPAAARALYERNAWRRAGNLLTLWCRESQRRPSESSTIVQCNGRGEPTRSTVASAVESGIL